MRKFQFLTIACYVLVLAASAMAVQCKEESDGTGFCTSGTQDKPCTISTANDGVCHTVGRGEVYHCKCEPKAGREILFHEPNPILNTTTGLTTRTNVVSENPVKAHTTLETNKLLNNKLPATTEDLPTDKTTLKTQNLGNPIENKSSDKHK